MSFRPFSEPGDGAQYERFADDARYSIHITDPKTGATKLRYDFIFSPRRCQLQEPQHRPFLRPRHRGRADPGGRRRAAELHADVSASSRSGRHRHRRSRSGLLTPPPNVGKNVTPFYNDANGVAVSGAATLGESRRLHALDDPPARERRGRLGRASRRQLLLRHPRHLRPAQRAHPRQQRHLADGLGQDGNGVDGFKGFNVLSIAMQIPVSDLNALGIPTGTTRCSSASRKASVSTRPSSRPRITVRKDDGTRENKGGWIQVSRLGNPLFTEGLVAFKDKDRFNRTAPKEDATFATYARNPELATLINAVYGTNFVDKRAHRPREDLHSRSAARRDDHGPGRGSPASGLQPARVHRRRHDQRRLGWLAEWPAPRRRRGRHRADRDRERPRLLDDHDGRRQRRGERHPYNQVFPYLATPHSGTNNRKDPAALDD